MRNWFRNLFQSKHKQKLDPKNLPRIKASGYQPEPTKRERGAPPQSSSGMPGHHPVCAECMLRHKTKIQTTVEVIHRDM
jgi:hypothetical protein